MGNHLSRDSVLLWGRLRSRGSIGVARALFWGAICRPHFNYFPCQLQSGIFNFPFFSVSQTLTHSTIHPREYTNARRRDCSVPRNDCFRKPFDPEQVSKVVVQRKNGNPLPQNNLLEHGYLRKNCRKSCGPGHILGKCLSHKRF